MVKSSNAINNAFWVWIQQNYIICPETWQVFVSLTWSVVLRAFELVELVPRVQEVRRIAALNTVEAARKQIKLRHLKM